MAPAVPVNQKKYTLNDGRQIPAIGLGTFLSAPSEVKDAVIAGYKSGIRHFDCAQFYNVRRAQRDLKPKAKDD